MSKKPVIDVYPTYFALKPDINGHFCGIDMKRYVGNHLAQREFNKWQRKWNTIKKYYHFDYNSEELRIPRHILDTFLVHLGHMTTVKPDVVYHDILKPSKTKPAKFKLKRGVAPRPDQIIPVDFLANEKLGPMRAIEIQTGKGKTPMSIFAMVKIDKPTLIVVPSNLVKQWIKSIKDFLVLDSKDICVLSGHKSIAKVLSEKVMNSSYRPKIFIMGIRTGSMWTNNEAYDLLPFMQEFIDHYGIETKIFDECHLNFQALCRIDMEISVRNNLYLSATYDRSDYFGSKIFHTVFPKSVKHTGEYDTYVDIYVYSYSTPREPAYADIHTDKGYNHNLYEDWIYSTPGCGSVLINLIIKCIDKHFLNIRNKEQKLLILASKVETCEKLAAYLKERYSNLRVSKFVGGDSEDNLYGNYDMVISTPGSSGTGRDVKNLRSVINTVSVGSYPLTTQILGRLRKLDNGDIPEFVDIFNVRIEKQRRHAETRIDIYKERARAFHQIFD